MKRFLYLFIVLTIVVLTACDSTSSSSTTRSSVAQLTAFAFANDTKRPALSKAVFTVEERVDTGLVWNRDSIQYGTSLDTVIPRFTFAATPGAAFVRTPDTLCVLTGNDTLNFSKQPIYLTIRSADSKTLKTYEIKASVHQVDPDLYAWEQIADSIYPQDDSEQKVVSLNNNFVMIKSNGFELNAYESEDGEDWVDLGEPEGLPIGTRVRQIISSGDTLYYGDGKNIYTSADAIEWTAHSVNYTVQTMVLYWNKEVWALVDNSYQELAIWKKGSLKLTGLKAFNDVFPISDFATVCFNSASERERAMIIGGFAENGRSLNTRWNLEYSPHIPENGGYRMEEYSIDRPQFTSLTGASVIWYNNQLMMFGGVNADMNYFGRDILISKDEGLNWVIADTVKNRLPEVYHARQKQNTIVRDNNIYLFGGQDATRTYSDVYKGRLNSIGWK